MGVFVMEIQLLYRTIGGHSAVPLLVVSGQSGHPSVVFCTWTCNAHNTSISLPHNCRGLLRVPTPLCRHLHMDMQCTLYIHQLHMDMQCTQYIHQSVKAVPLLMVSGQVGHPSVVFYTWTCNAHNTSIRVPHNSRGLLRFPTLLGRLLHMDMQCTLYTHQSVTAQSHTSWSLDSSVTPLSSSAHGHAMHTIHPSVAHGHAMHITHSSVCQSAVPLSWFLDSPDTPLSSSAHGAFNAHNTSIHPSVKVQSHCRGLWTVRSPRRRLLHMDMQCTQSIHQSATPLSCSLESSNTPLSSSAPGHAMHIIHPSVCHSTEEASCAISQCNWASASYVTYRMLSSC